MNMELTTSLRAWLKLVWFMKNKKTEVGAFGITPDPSEPLYVDDLYVPEQNVGAAHVHFTEDGIENAMLNMTNQKMKPWQGTRLWFHTHPGDGVTPSNTDETTFTKVFGGYSWAIMAILGQNATTRSCRLRIANEKGMSMHCEIPWNIDFSRGFDQLDIVAQCTEDIKRIRTDVYKKSTNESGTSLSLVQKLKKRFDKGLPPPLSAIVIRSHRPWFNDKQKTIHIWHPDSYKAVCLGVAKDIPKRKGYWKAECWGAHIPWPQMYKWTFDADFVPDALKEALRRQEEQRDMDATFLQQCEFSKGLTDLDVRSPSSDIILLPKT